ncbi:MAG: L,D-transpeptidase family protein [Candidatus Omnitrophica bacterium]|nr:L,D-transpeptidase family protein [Candidatus Omnitrophota bacterium]
MKKRWIVIIVWVILLATIGIVIAKGKKGALSSLQPSFVPVQKLLEEAAQDEAGGDKLKAKQAYQEIILEYPDYDKIEEIQNKLGNLNMGIIFSTLQTPQSLMHQVEPGDSLGKLAKQYGTTKELIKRSNGLKSDVIRVGQKLRIWKASFSVLINKSQNILILKSGQEVIKMYHVATGREDKENATPIGIFKIASKIPHPVWFKAGSAPIPPESPENELGSRWMGFDVDPHYGIHGTIHPRMIGEHATAGCVRLTNPEVEELFDLLPMGTQVTIQN